MAIFDLFSKRYKKLRGKIPDVFMYEEIPNPLRVQIVHIIQDTFGLDRHGDKVNSAYQFIHKTLCKEYGVFTLKDHAQDDREAILDYFFNCEDYEQCLDIIEICFRLIENYVKKDHYHFEINATATQEASDGINELNSRFKESGIGYQFESGELTRVDSQFIHSEAVKPVLHLLGSDKKYNGANDEFLSAHEHYRHKRYKEYLNDCLKSFESLMKAIHEKHSCPYDKSDTAKKLINSCLTNKLVPEYLQNQFSSIRILLESGIPTVRNKQGGHGQGAEITTMPEHLAS